MRPSLVNSAVRSGARSLRGASYRTSAAPGIAAAALAIVGPCLPAAAGSERSLVSAANSTLGWYSAGLSPQQAFAAHSQAQMGMSGSGSAAAAAAAARDEAEQVMAALLHQHLEDAFAEGLSLHQAGAPPASMFSPPAHAPAFSLHPMPSSGACSIRASTQAVAARLTKHP